MKKILITGGAKRLGAALVEKFHEKGHQVCFFYNTSVLSASELEKKLLGTKAIHCNLRETNSIEEAYNQAENFFGLPDVLINNSGIFPPAKKVEDISEEDWDTAFDVNLKGHFFISKAYYTSLKLNNKRGRIINIASLGGVEIWDNKIQYNVSKSGLVTLTKAMARNMAPSVSVNCISPGSLDLSQASTYEDSPYISAERIPMLRHGNAQDIFEIVDFFANCTDYITGQNIIVDGGFNLI